MKTILVTGATGFVGSHLLEALAGSGARIIAAARDRSRLPADFSGEARIGDFHDADYREGLLEGVDGVCHCFAWTSATGNADHSRRLFLEPTLALLDACAARGVRVVFPSSTHAVNVERLPHSALRGGAESYWPHMANVRRIERHMERLAAAGASMTALRLGLFVGRRFGIGMLPLLLPRLRTHLVPYVGKGRATLPLIAGEDIGRVMALAALNETLTGFQLLNAVGPETPTARELFRFLNEAYGYPRPHFGVSYGQAYAFARLMETLSKLHPGDPFLTRSIVFLLEETGADNRAANERLGFVPAVHWKTAIRAQMAEMAFTGTHKLPMARALPAP